MKIHYTASIWHGGFYKFFGNALTSLGHEVHFFDDTGTPGQKNKKRILERIPKFQYRASDKFRTAVSNDWLASVEAYRPDLLIMEHAPNILPEYIAKARALGAPIFYWMDSPPAGAQAKDAIAGLRYADKIFSIDRKWMTILYGPKDFIHLPLAGDETVFKPLDTSEADKKYDVVFIGSCPPQSGDGYLRADILANIPESVNVAVLGNGADYWTRDFPSLRGRVLAGRSLSDTAVNEIYNESRIVLNIHSTWHFSSLSARTYEIALSGAFQLVDFREDLDILFPKDTFVMFHEAREVNGVIESWLAKSPEERAARAAKIREYVLAHHTWRHRAQEMLKHFTSTQ